VSELDWASAEIKKGTLTIGLSDKPPKAWSQRLEAVLTLLKRDSSPWGEIAIGKHGISVKEAPEGAEDELRHFLESLVLQVNSDLAATAQDESVEGEEQTEQSRDEKMTETFRAFSQADDSGETD
jgi:hypothetical protein